AWIERIRDRRDAGDRVAARESLLWLVESHPQLVLPPDLRELLDYSP
ncbi:MAG: hypothetical protein H0W24_07040, partial [Lysobacter sp.]|nr:hypothetical protein [Lysobacter sp.]